MTAQLPLLELPKCAVENCNREPSARVTAGKDALEVCEPCAKGFVALGWQRIEASK